MLSKDDLLKDDPLPTKSVAVPEWGGDVFVRTMRGDERDDYELQWIAIRKAQDESTVGFRAFTVAYCLANEDGSPLFPEPAEVYKAIGRKSGKGLDRIFDVACRLNGLSDEDQRELEKN